MVDRAGVSRATPGLQPDPFGCLAETFETQHPDDYAVLAWRPDVVRDAATLRHAIGMLTSVLTGRLEWADKAGLSRLQGEFLYAVHARELAKRLDAVMGIRLKSYNAP